MSVLEKPITKKAAKAAQVEANKLAAFAKKVRSLVGHVPVTELNVGVAYHAGLTAEDYAAQIASREPVGKAVHPLKVQAVEQAEKDCRETLEKIRAKLEAHGWDLNAVAPYPESWNMSREAYQRARSLYSHYANVTRSVESSRAFRAKTNIVEMDEKLCERRVQQWREGAAFNYDAFICKLVAKIGPDATDAKLEGSHVWGFSILTVTKECGRLEHWKTQQITNCSVLGLYFPQWPTRLMKG